MAINDETIRLILQITGTNTIEEANAKLTQLKGKLEDVVTSGDKATKSTGNLGYGLLTAGRGIQDFAQGGVGGILNNIEAMTTSLGLGAGMAGALTAVGVALFVLKKPLQEFFAMLQGSPTKTEAQAMKELEENTHRTAEETEKLNKFKKEQIELTKILASTTTAKQEEQAGFEDFFTGQGKQIQGAIAGALGVTGRGAQMTAEEARQSGITDAQIMEHANKAESQAIGRGASPAVAARIRDGTIRRMQFEREQAHSAAQTRINQANVDAAGGILARAPTDIGARATIRAMATQVPGAFPAGFAGDFASMEPAAMAQQDKDDAAFQAKMEQATKVSKMRRDAARKSDITEAKDIQLHERVRQEEAQSAKKQFNEFVRKGHQFRETRDRLKKLNEGLSESLIQQAENMHWITAHQAKIQRQALLNQEIRRRQIEIRTTQSALDH